MRSVPARSLIIFVGLALGALVASACGSGEDLQPLTRDGVESIYSVGEFQLQFVDRNPLFSEGVSSQHGLRIGMLGSPTELNGIRVVAQPNALTPVQRRAMLALSQNWIGQQGTDWVQDKFEEFGDSGRDFGMWGRCFDDRYLGITLSLKRSPAVAEVHQRYGSCAGHGT